MITMLLVSSEQALLYIPLCIGGYIVYTLMKITDLSIESSFTCGAIGGYYALKATQMCAPLQIPGILCSAAFSGIIVGLTTYNLVRFLPINHLLASIITIGLFKGIQLMILRTTNVSLASLPNPLTYLPSFFNNAEYYSLAIITLSIVCVATILFKTEMGTCFIIMGKNRSFFKHFHIKEKHIMLHGMIISHALAGISGYLCAQSHNFVDVTMGYGLPLFIITTLILGKTIASFFTITIPSITIVCCGVFSYFMIQQGLLAIGFDAHFFTSMQACVVLFILFCNNQLTRHSPLFTL